MWPLAAVSFFGRRIRAERVSEDDRPPRGRGVGRSDMKFGKREPTALVSPTVVCFCAAKEEGERRRWPTGKDAGRRGDARDRWRSRRGLPKCHLNRSAHIVLPKLFQSLITTSFESLEQVQSTLHGGDPNWFLGLVMYIRPPSSIALFPMPH